MLTIEREPGQIASEGYVLSGFILIVQDHSHETFQIYWQISDFIMIYLHFPSNPLINLYIFATVYSSMNYTNLIDWQVHLPVQ